MSAPAGAWVAGVALGFFWGLLPDSCAPEDTSGQGGALVVSSSSSSSSSSTTTGGEGGAGGQGGSGGAGGATATTTATTGAGGDGGQGGGPECVTAADCGQDGACDSWVCHQGGCLHAFSPAGSDTGDDGPVGDCQRLVCDGAGGTMPKPSANDVPDDGNDCTVDTCDPGPTFTAKPLAASCSTSGGHLCQEGVCVPFIPVKCKVNVDGQVYSGCDGVTHPEYSDLTFDGFQCFSSDPTIYGYCAPGTTCAVWKAGQAQLGKCQ